MGGNAGVSENHHARNRRYYFFKKVQILPGLLARNFERDAGNIRSWSGQTCNEAIPHRVDNCHHHNGNGCRRSLGSARCSITKPGDDDVNFEMKKFSRKSGILITLAPAIAVLECAVFSLDPSEFA